ncbi:MAG: DUF4124 domain-containing protein [Gammaproteobacteria bacterium]
MKIIINRALFCLALLFLIVVVPAQAGKIYKWTDKDGNVHFSNTPGPDQDASADIGDTKARGGGTFSRPQSLESSLRGTWYGSLAGQSYKLRVNGNTLLWAKTFEQQNSINSVVPVFEAVWKDNNGDLDIIYSNYPSNQSRSGKKDFIRIISKSDESLSLQFPDKRVYNLTKSIKHRRVGIEGKNLIGSWIRQSDGAEVTFKSGSFSTKEEIENRVGAIVTEKGNWQVADSILTMTYIRGINTAGRQGMTRKFKILLSDEQQLILSDSATKKQVVYNRKLAR